MLNRDKVLYSTTDLLELEAGVSCDDRQSLKTLIRMSKRCPIKDVPGSLLSIILNRIAVSDLTQDYESNQD